jgi:hypothetical protein
MTLGPRLLAACASLALIVPLSACGGEDDKAADGPQAGADVGEFCAAMAEVDSTIDSAQPGDAEDWEQVEASLENLREVGVPDDFPEDAEKELDHIDRLAQESDSLEEFSSAVEADPPDSRAVDDYLDTSCD